MGVSLKQLTNSINKIMNKINIKSKVTTISQSD